MPLRQWAGSWSRAWSTGTKSAPAGSTAGSSATTRCARALILVDLEEEFLYDDPPRCFIASLDGPPIAVALTVIRACDRVTRIVLAPPEAA